MNRRSLIGQRFGRLTVLEDTGQRKERMVVWRCRCDCGGERLVVTNKLTGGIVTDCGCVPRKPVTNRVAEDLTGQRFGSLTVLYRMENRKNRTQWMCRCDCGKLHPVISLDLKQGKIKSCGCKQYTWVGGEDLTGRRFDRVVALYPTRKPHKGCSAQWHCRCDCGREFDTTAYSLLSDMTHSCGCLTKELGGQLHTYLHTLEDTCVENLIKCQKNFKNNTSGFRGVTVTRQGTYRVTINFQKRNYFLGTYKTFPAAVEVRLDAEKDLHAGFVQAYQNWQERAAADPAWAEINPFYYRVERKAGIFHVDTNGPETLAK